MSKIKKGDMKAFGRIAGLICRITLDYVIFPTAVVILLLYLYPNSIVLVSRTPPFNIADRIDCALFSLLLAISFGVGGIATALFLRGKAKTELNNKSTLNILLKDYMFEESATLNLISLGWAIAQGFLWGVIIFAIPISVANWRWGASWEFTLIPLLSIPITFFSLILVRLYYESIAAKHKERQVAIRFYQNHQNDIKIAYSSRRQEEFYE